MEAPAGPGEAAPWCEPSRRGSQPSPPAPTPTGAPGKPGLREPHTCSRGACADGREAGRTVTDARSLAGQTSPVSEPRERGGGGGGWLPGRHVHIPGGRMKGKACKIGWGCSKEGGKVTETKT